jgi:hypothetical protein
MLLNHQPKILRNNHHNKNTIPIEIMTIGELIVV